MKNPRIHICFTLLVFIMLVMVSPARGQETPQQILVLPFNIYAPQEYAYLKEGIAASLNSRLQRPGIRPLIPTDAMLNAAAKPNALLTREAIETIAISLGADLSIEGNVTIVGDAVSTTIQLRQTPGGKSRINFHANGDRPDSVLDHIDQFIQRLETELLGRATITPQTQKTAIDPASDPSLAPAVTWQSQRQSSAFKGLAIANLTQTPGKEIAIINDHDLLIFTRNGDSLTPLATIKGKPYLRLVAVDAADINSNGYAEIFVTAFHTRLGKPRSFVVEWDSSQAQFVVIVENLPTYLRVAKIPSQGERLLGQPIGLNDFFGKRPALLQWTDEYTATTSVDLPPKVHIYDFIIGPFIPGSDNDTIIALTHRKKISIFNTPDSVRWISEDTYGGSSVYLDDAQTPANQSKQLKQVGEETLKRHYLHPRMLLKDLDKDGIQDLLVVRNKDASGGLFRRARLLTSGRITCLNWQPLGPVAKWETPKVSGHITDIALDDTDGNGQNELVYVVVDRETKLPNHQQSYLVSHNLPDIE